jgi:chemotaxis protein histidine kinase CheA
VGLDAVRDLLEEAGGSIEVDSKETQGTTFYISIPEKILFL